MNKKKLVSMFTAVAAAFCLVCTPFNTQAEEITDFSSEAEMSESITPTPDAEIMGSYTYNAYVYDYSSYVEYRATTRITDSSITKVAIYLYFQEYTSSGWKDIQAISKVVSSPSGTIVAKDNYTKPVKGKKYRCDAHFYFYKGSSYTYIQKYSDIITKS